MIESLRLSLSIVFRNWTVYRKDFLANISPTIADPSLIMVSLGLGLGPLVQNVNGQSYLEFLAPGLLASTALFTSFFESSYGFYVRMTYESVFKAMLTTPIGAREIVIGEFIWNFLKGALMALGVGIFLSFFGLAPGPLGLLAAAGLGGLIALPCAAMGLLASSYVRNINQFQTVYSFLIAPIYFLSGTFFPLEPMPKVLQTIIQFSPFTHGVKLMQLLFRNEMTVSSLSFHGGVLVAFTVLLGLWSGRQIQKKLIL
jgi:lipooligosaccharide transport system permease protein